MLFHIRGIPTDIDVTSVVLEHNAKDSDMENLVLWHCPICNQPLFQFTSRMIMIVPGFTPSDSPPIIVICPRCKKKYLINSISSDKIT